RRKHEGARCSPPCPRPVHPCAASPNSHNPLKRYWIATVPGYSACGHLTPSLTTRLGQQGVYDCVDTNWRNDGPRIGVYARLGLAVGHAIRGAPAQGTRPGELLPAVPAAPARFWPSPLLPIPG